MEYTSFDALRPFAVCVLRALQLDLPAQHATAVLALAEAHGQVPAVPAVVVAAGVLGVHYVCADPARFDGDNLCDVVELSPTSRSGWTVHQGPSARLVGTLNSYSMRRPNELADTDPWLGEPTQFLYIDSDAVRIEIACRFAAVSVASAPLASGTSA